MTTVDTASTPPAMATESSNPSTDISIPRFTRQLMTTAFFYSSLAIGIGVVLILFGLDMTVRQIRYVFTFGMVLGGAGVMIVDYYSFRYFYRPLLAGLQAIEAGETHTPTIKQGFIHALNYPMLTFIRIMAFHMPTAVIGSVIAMVVQNTLFDTKFRLWHMVAFASATLIVGISHAILEYFAVLGAIRPIIAHLRVHSDPLTTEDEKHIIPVNIRQRLLFISIWTALIPLVTLGATLIIRVINLLDELQVEDTSSYLQPILIWFIFLAVVVTALTIGVALAVSRDMQELVRNMLRAMNTVEEGYLEERLEVTTTDEFAELYTGFNNMTRGLQERAQLHDAFGRYVSPEIAKQVLATGVQVQAITLNASVMFVDIRGFTHLSERLTPTQAVELLNGFFAMVEPVIKAEGGWINKFLGDGFMVIFGAPVPYEDHARRATRVAIGIRKLLRDFNTAQEEKNAPPINIGIGIECGEMVAGSIGSPDRIEYTVIGDTVNVASRIESLNKTFDTQILISSNIYKAAGSDVMVKAMPRTRVKGKTEPIQVYAVLN